MSTGSHDAARVVIVDDHELLRTGTRRILEEAGGFAVVGEAGDGPAALALVDELDPDVVLVDIRLPSTNGIDLARRIVDGHPDATVVVLSAYDDEDYVRAALSVGASAYLLKTTPGAELVRAIHDARRGTVVLDPGVVGARSAAGADDAAGALTARERQVVRLVARGLANKAIARQLSISPRTVEAHLNHAFEKLGASSRTELVTVALATGALAGADVPPTP
ncbi:MAG: response regulator transcription factor [Actinomycetota bacterium]|nr:response regulator transcription factor [Actinomycetota bacterium]